MSCPPVKELMDLWPALHMQSEVYAEFQRITNQNLPNTFIQQVISGFMCKYWNYMMSTHGVPLFSMPFLCIYVGKFFFFQNMCGKSE
ncbi:hypothetical protein CRENBAI_007780 [Crenichthys baileyi]|uniref:Uncharacterized protein n=1 Tax=Crenichthys baileyi TaxID=28760 RepID=A0AAV9S5K7_9TELE